ncbi:ABC transporter permease [Actinocrinis puniceicyclus]|nr:ABC transporter permease [Actinocrinis puniceicyclus]
MSLTYAPRSMPVSLGFGSKRSLHMIERNMLAYRRAWLILVSGVFEPVFYLLSIGVGLGKLIPHVTGPGGRPLTYVEFVAPALLATAAMQGAVFDSTFNIFFKIKYAKVYDAILSTPLGVGDIALGEVCWALLRGSLYAAAFLAVTAGFGAARSAWTPLALPAAVLIGYAFAGLGMGCTTFFRSWQDFDWINLAMMPMFLFSTTFFPLGVYPRWVQLFVECTPLYQGIEIVRGLTLGAVGPALLWRAVYLALLGTAGLAVATRRLGRLLLS